MPGPGGGSHSGGGGSFGGGGSHGGGGFGGGGFGGGFGPGPGGPGFGGPRGPRYHGMHYYYGPGYYGPRYYRGGCFGALIGPLIFLIFALIIVAVIIFSALTGSVLSDISAGGSLVYDEVKFQDFADAEYRKAFGEFNAYEDNILIAVLTEEGCEDYGYIAWVGDNIIYPVNELYGNELTLLGESFRTQVGSGVYKYNLDTSLVKIIGTMADQTASLKQNGSVFYEEHERNALSYIENRSEDASITNEIVDSALKAFTEQTGIPCVIVVEEVERVFSRKLSGSTIFAIGIAGVFVVIGLIALISSICKYRKSKASRIEGTYDNNGSPDNERNTRPKDPYGRW